MSTALVCLSKLGDVINAIPIAHAAFKRTGKKVKWVVSLHYATPLLACSFVEPIKVQYAPDNISLGIQTAKKTGASEILLAQCFGKHWKGRHDQSFNKTAWTNCGMEAAFDDLYNYPLVFDRRDPDRESMLCRRTLKGNKPVILLSLACGKSSPFNAHQVFTDSIVRKWVRSFEIIDLCKVRAARIYDTLGLMDRAALLITCDSAPLHLAAASPQLPVIFLSNNQPFLASDPRCRCILRLKYDEWHKRIKEVHAAICRTLTG